MSIQENRAKVKPLSERIRYRRQDIETSLGAPISVDCEGLCGQGFHSVAHIFEIESENPLVSVPVPLGINAIRQILDDIENGRVDV